MPATTKADDKGDTDRRNYGRRTEPCLSKWVDLLGHGSPSRTPVEGGKLLGVSVLDHIIVGSSGRYVSLREKGLI